MPRRVINHRRGHAPSPFNMRVSSNYRAIKAANPTMDHRSIFAMASKQASTHKGSGLMLNPYHGTAIRRPRIGYY